MRVVLCLSYLGALLAYDVVYREGGHLEPVKLSDEKLLEILGAYLHGRKPNIPSWSVCIQCKLSGVPCVMVSQGIPCLGPVTQAGCGAFCPKYNRGCYGCFGPMESANAASLSDCWKRLGASKIDIMRAYRTYNAYSEAFRRESEAHEQ